MSIDKERDFQEFVESFNKNLLTEKPSIRIREWQVEGRLKLYMRNLDKCLNVQQDLRYHTDDVFEHCIKTCDYTPADPILRWAGLLHDVGKAKTVNIHVECGLLLPDRIEFAKCPFGDRGCTVNCRHALQRPTFYRHERASKHIAVILSKKFGLTNRQRRTIVRLVEQHMYFYEPEWSDEAILRFIKKTGITARDMEDPDNYPLFRLRRADRESRGFVPVNELQREFEERLRNCLETS